LVVEDFKNENGEWAYQPTVDGKKVFTVGGGYYHEMTKRCRVGGRYQKNNPTYIGCTTTFKSCHAFVEFARTQIGYGEGDLDKDILLKRKQGLLP
jgi:hypothetical protein